MTITSHIFLGDASRGVGDQLAYSPSGHNHKITALLDSQTTKTPLESMGLKTVLGDALDAAAMEKSMQQYSPIDGFISTVFGLSKKGKRADDFGKKNLIDTAVKAGGKNFILVSSIGADNSRISLFTHVLKAVATTLIEQKSSKE